MNVTHWGLNKRARNEIEITVPDSLSADFSVAITDAAIDTDSTDNIISHLLLSSDLKAQIFNPAYYFSSNDNVVTAHLDRALINSFGFGGKNIVLALSRVNAGIATTNPMAASPGYSMTHLVGVS